LYEELGGKKMRCGHPEALPLSTVGQEGCQVLGVGTENLAGWHCAEHPGTEEVRSSKKSRTRETELQLRNWQSVIWKHTPKPEPREFIRWHSKHGA